MQIGSRFFSPLRRTLGFASSKSKKNEAVAKGETQVKIAGRTGTEVKADTVTRISTALAVGGSLGLLLKAGLAVTVATQPLGLAAAAIGTAVASYAGADFLSGVVHHAVDNYAKPGKGALGKLASEYTAHHYFGNSVHQVEATETLNPFVKLLGPALAGLALAPVNPLLGVAAAVGLGGSLVGFLSHRFAHQKNPSKMVRTLQRVGLLQDHDAHGKHHRMPFSEAYTAVNGSMNPLLDKTDFWRKWEKGIHTLTGAEPKTWQHPAIRDFAMGEIDKQEYLARLESEIPVYMANVNFKEEREAMKQFLHGRFES